MSKYGVFSGPYFPVFGLNTEIYYGDFSGPHFPVFGLNTEVYYGVFSGPYLPVFGLNTEIYRVNLRIQSEYRKTRTRKISVFEQFSRRACIKLLQK